MKILIHGPLGTTGESNSTYQRILYSMNYTFAVKELYMFWSFFHPQIPIFLIATIESGTSQPSSVPTNSTRNNILSNGTIGARLVRAARARQIHARFVQVISSKRRETVELLSAIGDVVGMATTELALGSGMELHGLKIVSVWGGRAYYSRRWCITLD